MTASVTQFSAQRIWFWHGWKIHYSYQRAAQPGSNSMPFLLMHGFGSSLAQWQRNWPLLSQEHTVYALDMLGFGASEKAATRYKIQLWADQIYEFWRTMIGQPMILVGHSLGAVVSLTAAVQHPEMVKGLVLLTLPLARQELLPKGVSAIAFTAERLFTNPLLLAPAFWILKRPRILRAALKAAYVNLEYVTDELVSSFVTPILDKGAGRVFFRLAQARTDADYSPEVRTLLPQLEKPILLLWGQQDRVVPLSQGQGLRSLNPHLTLVEISEAGHCLYDEQAERVNQEILGWMATLP